MESIGFIEFCNNVNNLNSENDKIKFIENYKNYKESFDGIDKIMSENVDYGFDAMTLDELLNLAKNYETQINNGCDLTIIEFKKMQLLTETIELRLENEKMVLVENSNNY